MLVESPTTGQTLKTNVVIIGAGPTGLTAAYQLSKAGLNSIVLEKDLIVGGIARTEQYKGYHIDIGGHRFYTKIEAVSEMWHEVLREDFLRRPRLSRIYYDGKFFHYPIRLFDTLLKLGPVESLRIVASYTLSRLFPYPDEDNFEQWVSNRFGRRLYHIFFKTYTEKVWGIPCTQIKADWAAQRIKDLSLSVALRNALLRPRNQTVKTLIQEFDYPQRGPGMLWERVRSLVEAEGHKVLVNHDVVSLAYDGKCLRSVTAVGPRGSSVVVEGDHFISSISLSELVQKINPPPSSELIDMARQLTYRDFLTVALVVRRPHLFPDNWIYIHSPDVKVGRVQNFKNWSPAMVRDDYSSCLGLEYFCNEGDELWCMDDADLVELGKCEMAQLGLLDKEDVTDGVVFRQSKAYPIYIGKYKVYLNRIKTFIDGIPNLQTVGRNGLHIYNNQDHSMLTAMLAVKNILGEKHDVWEVNVERAYHEEVQVPHSNGKGN
jgi:protoporphyrinogen oxidase